MASLKERQKKILQVLAELGGVATTQEIGRKAHLHNNGVSQSLNALQNGNYVECLGGKRGMTKWRLPH